MPRHWKRSVSALIGLVLCSLVWSPVKAEQPNEMKELIVLAAPRHEQHYYADVADDIFDFHVAFAREIMKRDNVLVLADSHSYKDYVKALGEDAVGKVPAEDIWIRDFGLANPAHPVLFRYTAAGQGGRSEGQAEADFVQERLTRVMMEAGLTYKAMRLFNDGGNLVEDNDGRAVLSRKFLRDNGLSEAEARKVLKKELELNHIAFIEADEQGGLEHADGVVAFVEPNTLIINSYPDDPNYAAKLRTDLKAGLPGVDLHEIVTPYDGSEIYDERFGSACGLYTNMLVTPHRIYFPQFGIPEDSIALEQIQSVTTKEIVPIRSDQVCHMGGGVRCMSWQLRGENVQKLFEHLAATDWLNGG